MAGQLAGLYTVHQKYGKLPWASIVKPCEDLARNSFKISRALSRKIASVGPHILSDESFGSVFAPNGQILVEGQTLRLRKLADTLAAIGKHGMGIFYNVITREPLISSVLGYNLLTVPPPASSGAVVILILKTLSKFDNNVTTSLFVHRTIEALKYALALRMNLGDPGFVNITNIVNYMTADSTAQKIKNLIDNKKTFDPVHYGSRWTQVHDHRTNHLCIVDRERNVVTMTTSINTRFRSKIMSESTGIFFNNQMYDFSIPTSKGKPGAPANYISPYKRPLSSMAPIILLKVEKAISDKKQIIFTGHSSGASTAILASIWFFEKYIRLNRYNISPFCLTFGSPLVASHIFSHALRRENWARFFINFMTKHDVIPRIMLTPLPQIEHGLTHVLEFLNPKSPYDFLDPNIASSFMLAVMRNSLSVASHAACYLKGCTNLLLETVANIVELSPYRPFGFFVFCTGNGKLVVLDNPDAVLQLMFFSLQLGPEEKSWDFIRGMFGKHLVYENELNESLNMQDVTYLANLVDVPLSSSAYDASAALNDLGLTTRARLCLRAAGELEKQKRENEKKINSNKDTIKEALTRIQEYKTSCEIRKIGYYDAFKIQKDTVDFDANVKRLELTGIWDEIMEMIKRYELPDGFEARKEWIELGTLFRRLLEPLDIANYYRHLKNEDTGPYMVKGRPKRYRFTQRWREHAERMEIGMGSETTFWAEVEELRVKPYGLVKDEILRLEEKMVTWVNNGWLKKDVFLDESTFTKWWRTLPFEHRLGSCVSGFISTT
ncbi:gamma-glutamyltranspeptidase 1 [Striga asiatica]|uniref:Gamma-glutamyltranspeptidase 1 n=1 Tax=Striga asiatica TaxID=4170 RepID=A0A5A7Q112_STRAF|nr:gamma-glutamyltranspeptidase 1 [Striga asiatica]